MSFFNYTQNEPMKTYMQLDIQNFGWKAENWDHVTGIFFLLPFFMRSLAHAQWSIKEVVND